MTGQELKEIMATVLPNAVLQRTVDAAAFKQRERKRDALKFLRAMLVSASSPAGGRQADIMRTYFENGAPRVARGSFYDWFGRPLEEVMNELSGISLAYAASQPKDLPGALGCVDDWLIVDSTTVRLHDRLKDVYPGAGDYAALKLHKTLSVGHGTVVAYHWSPAREHDSPHLVLDESWRGKGLLVDLGYASLQRLRDCQRFDVTVVMRLKENWNPRSSASSAATSREPFCPGRSSMSFSPMKCSPSATPSMQT
jgi:Transposase DDE domain